jgi:hypothetical protein
MANQAMESSDFEDIYVNCVVHRVCGCFHTEIKHHMPDRIVVVVFAVVLTPAAASRWSNLFYFV